MGEVVWSDVSRFSSSGGAFGYFDGWPTGSISQYNNDGNAVPTGDSLSLLSNLANTLKYTGDVGYGASIELLFAPSSSDPSSISLPHLFDINFSIGTEINFEGVEIGGIRVTSDGVYISILGEEDLYTAAELTTLAQDLTRVGLSQTSTNKLVLVIENSLSAISVIDSYLKDFARSLNGADFASSTHGIKFDFTSGMSGHAGGEFIANLGARTHVIGSNYGDEIFGGSSGDFIYGGAGEDIISGGSGNDTVVATISSGDDLKGGSGFDVLRSTGGSADLSEFDFEVIIGSSESELFAGGGLRAGGAGADTFTISAASGLPTVVWGGEDADIISVTSAQNSSRPVGILVVNAQGLTEENFHLFDIESLGLGNSFDWAKIDVVVVNPDASDEFYINGARIGVGSVDIPSQPGSSYLAASTDGSASGNGVTTLQSDWLGGGSQAVFAPWLTLSGGRMHVLQYDSDGNPFLDVEWYPNEAGAWIDETGQSFQLTGAQLSPAPSGSGYPEGSQIAVWGGISLTPMSSSELFASAPWFVVGGSFSGEAITSSSSINYTVPAVPADDGIDGLPQGGGYMGGQAGANLSSGLGVQRLGGFDATSQSVVIDGQVITASTMPEGMSAYEFNGSTIIRQRQDDFIVLRGVSLAEWQSGSNSQITGTVEHDSLIGTGEADVFVGGSGNDTVYAGAGDDKINFSSGDDLILGGDGNSGWDTLDVRLVTASDAVFSLNGNDVLIATTNGTIRLEGQILNDIGSSQSNIEVILFADAEMSEFDIRQRAVNDQASEYNDAMYGTAFSDLVFALGGNDTILSHAGDDYIEAGDGDDLLNGGTGADIMLGGQGNDTYIVDSIDDVVSEYDGEGHDAVHSSVSYVLGAAVEALILTSSFVSDGHGNELSNKLSGSGSANRLFGQGANDSLYGGGGADSLYGGEGADYLNGGAQSDYMAGGDGDDIYVVNAAKDVVFEVAGEGIDLVQSNVDWTLGANIENLFFYSSGGYSGTGNALDNVLTGNLGANILSGLGGNDTLIGGAGSDTLTGGAGEDRFVFFGAYGGVDVVTDFNELAGGGEQGDKLRFEGVKKGVFAYLGDGAFTSSGNTEARVLSNQLLLDANGDGVVDFIITLTGLVSSSQLSASDFEFA